MKSQSLPMRTIVFIIIALIVVAAVIIMYIVFSGKLGLQTQGAISVANNTTHNAISK